MDGVPSFLILMLLIVVLLWRRARRSNQLEAARRAAEQARNSFTLAAREDGDGRGFDILDADGAVVDADALRWETHGLEVLAVAEFLPGPEEGGSADFAPGNSVHLIPTDTDPVRVEVWNEAMTRRAGELPHHAPPGASGSSTAEAAGDCIVLWEELRGGRRTGLRLLLVREDMLFDG